MVLLYGSKKISKHASNGAQCVHKGYIYRLVSAALQLVENHAYLRAIT